MVVSITATAVAPERALEALAAAIAVAKRDDTLARVTVAVPTNTCGVMARRALGRSVGIAAVDMVTLNRLAELIAGPELAAAERSPMSTPVVDLAVAAVLARDPGPFRSVASHPSTIVALRQLHTELRLAGEPAYRALEEQSVRGRQASQISRAISATLAARWYDEADLFAHAAEVIDTGVPDGLDRLIVHLPQELSGLALEFVRALGRAVDVHVIVQVTGHAAADGDALALLSSLDVDVTAESDLTSPKTSGHAHRRTPAKIISTTDADDEVRLAVREVFAAARAGTPFERIALLWPTQRPYARLVEHHLDNADIPWNGRPGTTTAERLAPRLVLDLLDVDRRGLRRRSVFDLLADVPARDADGVYLPTAEWERVSREAGIARDDDWNRRLAPMAERDRWSASATSLREFITDLRSQLGHPAERRRWWDWAQWCTEQLDRWLGRHTLERLPDPEYRAWEALTRSLDRLRHLDPVGEPVTRHQFRSALEADLEASPPRQGRVGNGVTVGPLAGAVGLDVDVVIVLGAAEGMLPPTPTSDPLLSETDRTIAGLPTSDARALRLHRLLLAVVATSDVTLTVPRGDLRATSQLMPSRWIADWIARAQEHIDIHDVASHHAGLEGAEFPASPTEHRLRTRYTHVRAGGELIDADGASDDEALLRGVDCIQGRASDTLTAYDGDLSGAGIPPLTESISPSRLEAWTSCPHAYFVRYLLQAKPVDEPDDDITITALDRGSAHHDALDLFHRAVIDGDLPQPTTAGWTEAHRAALSEFFDQVSDRTERRGRTGRAAFWADERDRMRADLLDWLDHDSAVVIERGSTVIASEERFDGVATMRLIDGRAIAINGSIDRVDRAADGSLVVTDHKSGRNKYKDISSDDPTVHGSLFQLPSYAAAARAVVGEPEAVVRAEYGLLRKGNYERPGVLIDETVDARVSEALTAVVAGIESGWYPHRPERPGWRMYVSCEYCEPDHLGTAERWAEWDRKHHDPRLRPWFGDPAEPDEATS